jgi:hypothetical protein
MALLFSGYAYFRKPIFWAMAMADWKSSIMILLISTGDL